MVPFPTGAPLVVLDSTRRAGGAGRRGKAVIYLVRHNWAPRVASLCTVLREWKALGWQRWGAAVMAGDPRRLLLYFFRVGAFVRVGGKRCKSVSRT